MRKSYIWGIAVCILILLGVASYPIYKNYQHKKSLIQVKDTGLTDAEKKPFEDRLAKDEQGLKDAKTDDEKYNWLLDTGYNLYGLGRLADAEKTFNQAASLQPGKPVAYSGLFAVQVDMKDYKSASANIQKAISILPESPGLWKNYIALEIDRFNANNDQVNALYAEALNKTKSNIDVMTSYATWLEKSGDLKSALDYWQQAVLINPDNKSTYETEISRLQKLVK